MERANWRGTLGVLVMFGLIAAGCTTTHKGKATSTAPVASTATPVAVAKVSVSGKNTIPEAGLLLTKDGIEFAGVSCLGAYDSQTSGVVKNEAGRITAKTSTSTCTTTGDTYVWAYSHIKYNSLGQMTGYKLKLSASNLGKEHTVVCSKIMRDNLWEVVRYQVRFDGQIYQFQP